MVLGEKGWCEFLVISVRVHLSLGSQAHMVKNGGWAGKATRSGEDQSGKIQTGSTHLFICSFMLLNPEACVQPFAEIL